VLIEATTLKGRNERTGRSFALCAAYIFSLQYWDAWFVKKKKRKKAFKARNKTTYGYGAGRSAEECDPSA